MAIISLIITHPPDLEIVKNKSDENLESIFCSELVAEAFPAIYMSFKLCLELQRSYAECIFEWCNVIDRLVLHESMPSVRESFR